MSGILHLSDTHFGTERPQVVAALLRLSVQLAPRLAIVSGDITQRARRAEFVAAAAFIKSLSVPALVLPGNHDIPLFNILARTFRPYGRYARIIETNLSPVIDNDDLLVIGVNTTRARRHKDGEVSPAQIRSVSERLRTARPQQLRIVVTHQPIHVTRPSDETNRLHGYAEAIPAWNAAGADLILGGHIHLPYVRDLREAYPQLQRSTWVVQAGTAVSRRLRFKTSNSVNWIRYQNRNGAPHCEMQRWDFDDAADAFVLAGEWPLVLDRSSGHL